MALLRKRKFSDTVICYCDTTMSGLAGGFRAGRPAIRTYTTGVRRDFYTRGIGARDEVVDLTQFRSRLYNIEVCAPLS